MRFIDRETAGSMNPFLGEDELTSGFPLKTCNKCRFVKCVEHPGKEGRTARITARSGKTTTEIELSTPIDRCLFNTDTQK